MTTVALNHDTTTLGHDALDHDTLGQDRPLECYSCGAACVWEDDDDGEAGEARQAEFFDNPHSDKSVTGYLCDDCVSGSSYLVEFGYDPCESCDRYICKRNPRNGYQTWFRQGVCCACYQDEMLERGQPLSDLEGVSSGVKGDFYDDCDLIKAGYSVVAPYSNFKVTGAGQAQAYRQIAWSFMRTGDAIVTQYRRLSILGDEGYVTMWRRPASAVTDVATNKEPSVKRLKQGDE